MTQPPSKLALIQLWKTHECLLMRAWSSFPCPARLSLTVGLNKNGGTREVGGLGCLISYIKMFIWLCGYIVYLKIEGTKANPMVYVVSFSPIFGRKLGWKPPVLEQLDPSWAHCLAVALEQAGHLPLRSASRSSRSTSAYLCRSTYQLVADMKNEVYRLSAAES